MLHERMSSTQHVWRKDEIFLIWSTSTICSSMKRWLNILLSCSTTRTIVKTMSKAKQTIIRILNIDVTKSWMMCQERALNVCNAKFFVSCRWFCILLLTYRSFDFIRFFYVHIDTRARQSYSLCSKKTLANKRHRELQNLRFYRKKRKRLTANLNEICIIQIKSSRWKIELTCSTFLWRKRKMNEHFAIWFDTYLLFLD